MPRFALETNLPPDQIPDNFLTLCVRKLAKLSGKKPQFCVAVVIPNQKLIMANGDDICGIIGITCIGSLGVEENQWFFKNYSDLIREHLGIPKKRLYFSFQENLPENVAWLGKSFYSIVLCRKEEEEAICAKK